MSSGACRKGTAWARLWYGTRSNGAGRAGFRTVTPENGRGAQGLEIGTGQQSTLLS